LLERAVGVWEKTLGSKHPWVASGLNNLGIVYTALGRLALAETHFQRAIRIAADTLPPEHPNLAKYCASYAHLLRQLGRKGEARELEERARIAREKHAKLNLLGFTVDARQLSQEKK
jgi:tetratricopeptide (TPR) repeat protein